MTRFETVRVAAVQATPEILDAQGSVAKAVRLLESAANEGARLVVFPETFVSLYPSNTWAKAAAGFGGVDELWERMWQESVDVPGPLVDELAAACARTTSSARWGSTSASPTAPARSTTRCSSWARKACCTATAS